MSPGPTEPQAAVPPAADRSLDVRAMNCPLPILKTKAEFARMQSGEILKVTYLQQQYVKELEMFSQQTGNQVVHTCAEDDHHASWIRKT